MSSWIRLCQVRLRHAASVLGIIGRTRRVPLPPPKLAYEAGMPEDQLFGSEFDDYGSAYALP